jgi:hypothetical protein
VQTSDVTDTPVAAAAASIDPASDVPVVVEPVAMTQTRQMTASSDLVKSDSLPAEAIPATGLKLIMNLFPPSYINFV